MASTALSWTRLARHEPYWCVAVIASVALTSAAWASVIVVSLRVLLSPLPFSEPHNLLVLSQRNLAAGVFRSVVSPKVYDAWSQRSHLFESVGAVSPCVPFVWSLSGAATEVTCQLVSEGVFETLDVRPAIGRMLGRSAAPSGQPQLVINDSFWARNFARSPHVIGTPLELSGRSYLVVGVMPRAFAVTGNEVDVWALLEPHRMRTSRERQWTVIARRRAGVSLEQIRSELNSDMGDERPWEAHVALFADEAVQHSRPLLRLAVVAVILLTATLFITLFNSALSRSSGRLAERILILRMLGAGEHTLRRALTKQVLFVSAIGLVVSIPCALAGEQAGRRAVYSVLPVIEVDRDTTVTAAIVLGLSATAAAVLWIGTMIGVSRPFGSLGQSPAGSRDVARTLLLAAQLAIVSASVAGTLMVIRNPLISSDRAAAVRPERVLTMRLTLPPVWYPPQRRATVIRELMRALLRHQSVSHVAVVRPLPVPTELGLRTAPFVLSGGAYWDTAAVGPPGVPESSRSLATVFAASEQYFDAMGIKLLGGRTFTEFEADSRQQVAIITDDLRRALSFGDAIGKGLCADDACTETKVIVGVVDGRSGVLQGSYSRRAVFLTLGSQPRTVVTLVIRTSGEAAAGHFVGVVRNALPNAAIADTLSASDIIRRETAPATATLRLLQLVSALAIGVAMMAATSALFSDISGRRLEFAVRAALGATPLQILALVSRSVFLAFAVAVPIGAALSIVVARTMSGTPTILANMRDVWTTLFILCAVIVLTAAYRVFRLPSIAAALREQQQPPRATARM